MTAATWSAIAASLSALSAFLVMRIQRRNFLESVSPQIVIDEWSREDNDAIRFEKIRNVGRGVALHLIVNAGDVPRGDRPIAVMNTMRLPVVANEPVTVEDGSIRLWWPNAPNPDAGEPRHVAVEIKMYCWDTGGRRHETIYTLNVFGLVPLPILADSIAPGVMFSQRRTIVRSVRRLNAEARLRRIPLIGRAFRERAKK
jgi:hypothetical protein